MYQIHVASPKAIEKCPKGYEDLPNDTALLADTRAVIYPFEIMKVGHCFVVPEEGDTARLNSKLRKAASSASKKMKRSFTVIRHSDHGCFEIARVG